MADDKHRAGILQHGVFQGSERFHVQIVGRFVERGCTFFQLRQLEPVALPAGEVAHALLLVRALEVEAADIGTPGISKPPLR